LAVFSALPFFPFPALAIPGLTVLGLASLGLTSGFVFFACAAWPLDLDSGFFWAGDVLAAIFLGFRSRLLTTRDRG